MALGSLLSRAGCFQRFFPASVPEAKGHRHPRGHGDRGHARVVGQGWATETTARLLFVLVPPLSGPLLSDQQGGPERVSQQLTDASGLLMGVFHRCHAGALPAGQTHEVKMVRNLTDVLERTSSFTSSDSGTRRCGRSVVVPHTRFCPASPVRGCTHAPSPQSQRTQPRPADILDYITMQTQQHHLQNGNSGFLANTPPPRPCGTALPPSAETSSPTCLHQSHRAVWKPEMKVDTLFMQVHDFNINKTLY